VSEIIIFLISHYMDFTHLVILVHYESRKFLVNSFNRNKQTLAQMYNVDDPVHEYCCAIFLNRLDTWESSICIIHCKIKFGYKTRIGSSTEVGHEKSSELRFLKIVYKSLVRTSQKHVT
jgi:hypothetical protein